MSYNRLITQNLLASAAQAVSGVATRTAVEDLASLISTIALYDGLVVLGSAEIWNDYAQQSPLIGTLMSANLLEVRTLDDATVKRVVEVSRFHLASATNLTDIVISHQKT